MRFVAGTSPPECFRVLTKAESLALLLLSQHGAVPHGEDAGTRLELAESWRVARSPIGLPKTVAVQGGRQLRIAMKTAMDGRELTQIQRGRGREGSKPSHRSQDGV
jgi:hypothetical protein